MRGFISHERETITNDENKLCTNKYACRPSVNMRPQKGPQMELMWERQGKIPKKIQLYGCYLIRVPLPTVLRQEYSPGCQHTGSI